MAYVKLPKVVSDYAVGVQSANQALENNTALYDQFDAKHSVGLSGPAFGDPFLGVGRHDDVCIARTVADFTVDTSGASIIAFTLMTGPMVFDAPEYQSDGKWKIYVTTPRLFGAVASIRSYSASFRRFAQVRTYMDGNGPYAIVTTWNVDSGTQENYDFSLSLWTDSVA